MNARAFATPMPHSGRREYPECALIQGKIRTQGGRPECARIRDIQDTFLRPERPERTRMQDKIRTRRWRPEYPECARIQDALPPGPIRPECARIQDIHDIYFRGEYANVARIS